MSTPSPTISTPERLAGRPETVSRIGSWRLAGRLVRTSGFDRPRSGASVRPPAPTPEREGERDPSDPDEQPEHHRRPPEAVRRHRRELRNGRERRWAGFGARRDGRGCDRLEIGQRDQRTAVGRPAITLTREHDRDPGAERIGDPARASYSRAARLDDFTRR